MIHFFKLLVQSTVSFCPEHFREPSSCVLGPWGWVRPSPHPSRCLQVHTQHLCSRLDVRSKARPIRIYQERDCIFHQDQQLTKCKPRVMLAITPENKVKRKKLQKMARQGNKCRTPPNEIWDLAKPEVHPLNFSHFVGQEI